MIRKIEYTQDGSPTVWAANWQQTYHSLHGAVQESAHVFVESGFRASEADPCCVCEFGFGTGLNAFLVWRELQMQARKVHYLAFEKYPLEYELYSKLNYGNSAEEKQAFMALHECRWGEKTMLGEMFCVEKIQADMAAIELAANEADVVFFDAFSPDVQPELWTAEFLGRIARLMKSGGVFTTYSVKGHVRRSLREAGLQVEKIPGPPGKREILRAIKPV